VDVKEAAGDTAPLDVSAGGTTYRVEDRLAIGSVSNIYRCRFNAGGAGDVQAVFKVARDARANPLLANEADVLRRLHRADPTGRATPFLPGIEASLTLADDPGAPARAANVLRNHAEIRSPDELFSLAEVRAQYPSGVDARDMAWMWRRLLCILSFAHANDIIHAAVLPTHVLIEPAGHKLLLIDWCWAVHRPTAGGRASSAPGGFDEWYSREAASMRPAVPALDVALAARCMIELIGGDPVRGDLPAGVEPAIGRYFQRCISAPSRADAGQLLDDFDRLIEILWGPRTFRAFNMPAKAPRVNLKGD
jgi:hypothetical protein